MQRPEEMARLGGPIAGGAPVAAAPSNIASPPLKQRRRLWQLPHEAHDLLLGLSFEAPTLRALAEQALGRAFGARCVLPGGEADVLYSVVLDLRQRNSLSEALQAALQRRHAAALARWRSVRTSQQLHETWRESLQSDDLGGALWALLTHPLGDDLETAALYETRARVLARARKASTCEQRLAETERALAEHKTRAEALQQRLQAQQLERERLRQAHEAELAALRGAMRRGAPPVADEAETDALPRHARHVRVAARECVGSARPAPLHALARLAPATPSTPSTALAASPPTTPPLPPVTTASGAQAASSVDPISMSGRRLLCVGGMPGARQRYRAIVEAVGARFEYHDGGVEDSVARLDRQLASADIVVCHSGCLNHEAYRRVKGHCQRADKPCIYLERPSLTHFARTLGLAAASP